MISEFFLNIVFGFVSGIFNLLPDISWNVDTGAFATFSEAVSAAAYFLPMHTVSTIIGLIFAFGLFRIVIRVLRTIWDVLPLV